MRLFASIIAALITPLCVGQTISCGRTTAGPAAAVSPTLFGMHFTNPATTFPSTLGIGSVRLHDEVSMASIEPSNGTFTFTTMDSVVTGLIGNGVGDLVFTFSNPPAWMSTSATANSFGGYSGPYSTTAGGAVDNSGIAALATAVGQRYCGKIKNYEINNEVDGHDYWTGTASQLKDLAATLYPILKSTATCACTGSTCSPGLAGGTNPNAVIAPSISGLHAGVTTSGELAVGFLGDYLTSGGAAYTDALNYHGYGYSTTPEQLATAAPLMFTLASGNALTVPVFSTEGGWGQDADLPNMSDKVAFIPKYYLMQWTAGVTRVYWYALDSTANNGGRGNWGRLTNTDGSLNAAGVSYQQTALWMVGAVVTGYTVDGNSNYVFTLTRTSPSGYHGYIVWNSKGTGSYTLPTGVTHRRSLDATSGAATAGTTVTTSTTPVLYETAAP